MTAVRSSVLGVVTMLPLAAPVANAAWSGQAEAGFVMARGNTDTDTANSKLDLTTERNRWKHNFQLNGLYGQNSGLESSNRWDTRWQSDYRLNDGLFVYGALRYERDRFAGFEYQASLSSGLGYRFIDTPRTKLTGTLGAGYRLLRPEVLIKDENTGEVLQRIPQEKSDAPVGNAGLNFERKLTSNTTLLNKLLMETGSENTFVQNDLALQVNMTDKLALSVGYGVKHNTEPPEGLVKTDQLTTLNLVYRINK